MTSDLSFNDMVMPMCYTRTLLVYDYKIQNLGDSLIEFLEKFCPAAFGQVLADSVKANCAQIIPSDDKRSKIFSYSQQLETSFQYYAETSFQEFDVFPYSAVPNNESPIFFLHQIELKDGTVLAFGMHHQVTDGHGYFSLIERFSRWFQNPDDSTIENFIHDRSLMKPSEKIEYEHPEYTIQTPSYSFTTLPPMEVVVKKWRKQNLFDKLNITNKNLSFNDVLVSWLTKTISQIRKLPNDETVRVLMAANGREPLNLGPNYFGNCNFYMSIPFSMEDLHSKTVNELAEYFNREKKTPLTGEYMRSALAWVKAAPTQVFPNAKSFCGKDLAFTNWSRFPIYGINFGQGPPKRMTLPAARFDGLTLILPTATDELEVYIGLVKEHADEFLKQIE